MTVIAQDYHLTAGAWAACAWRGLVSLRGEKNLMDINPTKKNHILQLNEVQNCSVEPRWRYLCKIRVGISNRLSHRDQADMSVLGTRLINLRWRN